MDSLAVTLENSSGSLSVPPRLQLFLPVLLIQHQILSKKYFIVVLLLNFGGILQQKACPTMEYAQLIIQNKKMYRCSIKMCPIGRAKKYVSTGFWSITYKSGGIGECTGMLGNYSIFELK